MPRSIGPSTGDRNVRSPSYTFAMNAPSGLTSTTSTARYNSDLQHAQRVHSNFSGSSSATKR